MLWIRLPDSSVRKYFSWYDDHHLKENKTCICKSLVHFEFRNTWILFCILEYVIFTSVRGFHLRALDFSSSTVSISKLSRWGKCMKRLSISVTYQCVTSIQASVIYWSYPYYIAISFGRLVRDIWSDTYKWLDLEVLTTRENSRPLWLSDTCVRLLSNKTCLDTKPVLYQDIFCSLTHDNKLGQHSFK